VTYCVILKGSFWTLTLFKSVTYRTLLNVRSDISAHTHPVKLGFKLLSSFAYALVSHKNVIMAFYYYFLS
jgi:hypothetical protein